MRYILFLLVFLFCSNLYAAKWEMYAVEKPDGGVTIHPYFTGDDKTLLESLEEVGLKGLPYNKITSRDLPPDKTDRQFWTFQGGKVIVDPVAKQAWEQAEAQKEAARQAILTKLGITKEEFEKLGAYHGVAEQARVKP